MVVAAAAAVFALPGTVFPADVDDGPLHTSAPFGADAAAWLAAADSSEAPDDASAVILHRKNTFSFDADGRMSQLSHLVYQIRDQSAAETPFLSTVSSSWAPWHQERPEIRARVIAPDGTERTLEPTTLVEGPTADNTPDIFDDRLLLEGPLPGLRPGVVVEVETKSRDREPYFDAGTSSRHFLLGAVPIVREEVVIEAPRTLSLRFALRGLTRRDAEVTETKSSGIRRITIVRHDAEPYAWGEAGLPFDVAAFPLVEFSTARDWIGVATSYAKTVEQQLAGADVSQLLDGIEGNFPRRVKIDSILAALQARVRYVGLELGSGSLIPRTPDETLRREFGDCKDKSTVLIAALRAVGIDAHVALLRSGLDLDVAPFLPGIGLFNHAIVYVPASGDDGEIWIDPTATHARAGQLPTQVQGRQALVTGAGLNSLLEIPATVSADNRVVEERVVTLADFGPGTVVETSTFTGAFELERRSYESVGLEERRASYERYVKSQYDAEALGEFGETTARDFESVYILRLEALKAGQIYTDLDEAFAGLSIQGIFGDMPPEMVYVDPESDDEDAETRTANYRQTLPQVREYKFRVVPPPGFVVRELPENRDEAFGAAHYRQYFEKDGETVVASFSFDSGPRILAPEVFEETRQALAEFGEEPALGLFFDHRSSVALAAGRAREAILDLRATTASGGTALDHIRLARALLAVGLGGQARDAAERAVELAPELPIAHWSLGFMLSHDTVGRLRQGDFDYHGARSALERAVELGPDEMLARSELAILLDFDAAGLRHSEDSDLEAALGHYRTWREEFGSDFVINEMSTLVADGRWDELHKLTKSLPAGLPRDAWHVAALAMTKSLDRAAREARSLAGDRTQRATTMAGAAHVLIRGRQYPEAAELTRRAASIAANPAAFQHRADSLAKIIRIEDLEFPADDPLSVVKRIALFEMHPEQTSKDDLRPLLHPDLLKTPLIESEALDDLVQASLRTVRRANGEMSLRVLMESGFALAEYQLEGEDKFGYRVTTRWDSQTANSKSYAFVRPDGEGNYLIAAIPELPATQAWEILRRLDAGDLEGARVWLEWALDLTSDYRSADPLLTPPLRTVWPVGPNEDDPARLRLAAQVLLASDEYFGPEAIEPLEAVLEELGDDVEFKLAVENALADAYGEAERWSDFEALYSRFYREHPDSGMAYALLNLALGQLERYDEITTLAEAHLAREGLSRSEKIEPLRALANVAVEEGDFERFGELVDEIDAIDPDAVRNFRNVQAWELLFRETVPADAVEKAEAAARRRNFKDYASLHTLAAAYALHDRPLEAYRALSQAMALVPGHEPNEEDWLVLGFIAKSCGLDGAARKFLGRMEKPEGKAQLHSWELAQRHLAELDEYK
ncbi:MAG: DUF3857 domain-containing protein [Acidobacteriota bacterium]